MMKNARLLKSCGGVLGSIGGDCTGSANFSCQLFPGGSAPVARLSDLLSHVLRSPKNPVVTTKSVGKVRWRQGPHSLASLGACFLCLFLYLGIPFAS